MSWIFLSLLCAFFWAIANILDKYVLSKHFDSPVVIVAISGVLGLFASIGVYVFVGFEPLAPFHIFLALLAGVCFAAMTYLYCYSVMKDEISKIIPLFYVGVLFISVFAAIFLGEVFSLQQYLGILFLVGGAMLVSSGKLFVFGFGKAFWPMILAALCIAINQIITKYLLDYADFWTIFAYVRIGGFLTLIPTIVLALRRVAPLYAKHGAHPFGIVTLSETANLLGVLSVTVASTVGYVTLVNALSSVQPFIVLLFTVVISAFFPYILKEEIDRSTVFAKAIAIATMFVGVVLIQ